MPDPRGDIRRCKSAYEDMYSASVRQFTAQADKLRLCTYNIHGGNPLVRSITQVDACDLDSLAGSGKC